MFKWNESFATGIREIDNQHKRLFEIGEEIEILLGTYLGESTFQRAVELIDELKEYTVYHFDTEKNLFIKYNYPDMGEHLIQHQKFIDYFNSIHLDEVAEDQEEFLNNLLNYIAQWIFKHINNVDFQYTDFLKQAMK